jgi:hypothetical protein
MKEGSKINPLWILFIGLILFGPRIGSWMLPSLAPDTLQGVLQVPVAAISPPENPQTPKKPWLFQPPDTISLAVEIPCRVKVSDNGHLKVTAQRSNSKLPRGVRLLELNARRDLILTLRAPSFEVTESSDQSTNWLWVLRPKSLGLHELTLGVSAAPGYSFGSFFSHPPSWKVSRKCPENMPSYSHGEFAGEGVLLGNIQVVNDLGLTSTEDALFRAAGAVIGALTAVLGWPFVKRLFDGKTQSN